MFPIVACLYVALTRRNHILKSLFYIGVSTVDNVKITFPTLNFDIFVYFEILQWDSHDLQDYRQGVPFACQIFKTSPGDSEICVQLLDCSLNYFTYDFMLNSRGLGFKGESYIALKALEPISILVKFYMVECGSSWWHVGPMWPPVKSDDTNH